MSVIRVEGLQGKRPGRRLFNLAVDGLNASSFIPASRTRVRTFAVPTSNPDLHPKSPCFSPKRGMRRDDAAIVLRPSMCTPLRPARIQWHLKPPHQLIIGAGPLALNGRSNPPVGTADGTASCGFIPLWLPPKRYSGEVCDRLRRGYSFFHWIAVIGASGDGRGECSWYDIRTHISTTVWSTKLQRSRGFPGFCFLVRVSTFYIREHGGKET